MHINALKFALGAMLSQNPNQIIDRPIYYASRLMNNTKKNYKIIEKKTLTKNYVVKKFRHYFLGNKFTFLWIIKLCYNIWLINQWSLAKLLEGYDYYKNLISK